MSAKEPHWLLQFAENTYSQSGEDGVIAKALSILPDPNRVCVEFGAWDGAHLSNVRRLIEKEDYTAVLIEGNKDRFHELETRCHENEKTIPLNAYVGFDDNNNLDRLLEPHSVPFDFDLLSIDIDGNDFHIWQAIKSYRPKLVCIEFNPTIPTEVDFVQPADPQVNQGCSLSALCRLGQEKNYELICVLPFNAFFVDAKFFDLFEISNNQPQTLRKDLSFVTWLFSGYDGCIQIAGSKTLLWHGIELQDKEFQVMPKSLRSLPDWYSWWQWRLFKLFKWWRKFRHR